MDNDKQTKADRIGERRGKRNPRDPGPDKVERDSGWNPSDDIFGEKPPVDRGMDFEHPRFGKRAPKRHG